MAVNGEGKGLRWFSNHRGDEGWTICGEREMLRATAKGRQVEIWGLFNVIGT